MTIQDQDSGNDDYDIELTWRMTGLLDGDIEKALLSFQ